MIPKTKFSQFKIYNFTKQHTKYKISTIERLVKINPTKAKDFQVGFIAINKQGEYGAFSINPGFSYSVTAGEDGGKVFMAASFYK
jgi:isoaspartyl peptidase/L-asparaginase-like protein (Ntn-hydrolase superfamily)